MILNHQYQQHLSSNLTPMVFIHGLFGSLSNLGMLARHFAETRSVLQVDVRNHGGSGHSDIINYQVMAQDVIDTLIDLGIEQFVVIGHSMGGKIAMKLAEIAQEKIEKVIVLDIAPVQYYKQHHAEIFEALFAVEKENPSSRIDAAKIMRKFIQEEMVIQFLLKSFNKGKWMFNVSALFDHYADIMQWESIQPFKKPTLFLRGELSFYISKPEHYAAIEEQFLDHDIELIQGAGHWLHGEKPKEVLEKIESFLN